MKISYERSGGVAGLHKRAVVDTERLPPAERAAWEGLVAEARVFALPAALAPADPHQRDAFQHTITVEGGAERHTVTVHGTPASAPVRALVERLQGASTRAPG